MSTVIIRMWPDGKASVQCPIAAKEIVKAVPGRSWNPNAKVWRVPNHAVTGLYAALRRAGWPVDVYDTTGEPVTARAEPPPSWARDRTPRTWADAMFTELGQELGERAYVALLRVLHPDVGGSTSAMQALNVARDRVMATTRASS